MALGKGRSETRGSVFQEFVIVSVFCRLKCLLSDMVPGVACGVRVGLTAPLSVGGVDRLVWLPMQGVQVRAAALGAVGGDHSHDHRADPDALEGDQRTILWEGI